MSEEVPLDRKYGTTRTELADLVTKLQQRKFAEDVDWLESKGGVNYIIDGLAANIKRGLASTELEERERYFGSNKKEPPEPSTFCELFWEALEDLTLRILLVCAVGSIAIEVGTADEGHRATSWIEGFAIFVAVMICALVTSVNNYRQERQFRVLNDEAASRKKVNVFRDGQLHSMVGDDLLVGDIVKIFEGMDIPADGFLLEGHEITSDEAAMTGEPDPIKKATYEQCIKKRDTIRAEGSQNTSDHHAVPSPILYSGTKVLTGEGLFVVIVVGELSCEGRIKDKLHTDPEATPLQQKLEAIADAIGKFGLYAAIITLLVLVIRFIIDHVSIEWEWKYLQDLLNYVILAITVLVVAIPEGLPLAVTLSLAYSVKKMLADQNLVRRIEACETMGGANVICSDKTGTLTQNKMTLTTMYNDEFIELDLYANSLDLGKYCPPHCQDLIIQGMACNSSATLDPLNGSKTEIATLEFLQKCGLNYETYRTKHMVKDFIKFPFSSQRKRMSTVIENVESTFPSKQRLHIKGASEIVLDACSTYHSYKENRKIPMTPEIKKHMEEAIEKMANRALRTIVMGYKDIIGTEDMTTKDAKNVFEVEKKDITLLCILGIKDILRKEVPPAIKQCHTAGIKVKMVTGDNKLTARAIAKECGIIEEGDTNAIALEGVEFMERTGGVVCKACKTALCDCPTTKEKAELLKKDIRVDTIKNAEEFDKIYMHLMVLARSRPEDKYALVTGLRERGLVVAVTGDGTNDAPALKKADVGFAMGIAGTEVAREASSIILLDDNFNSIVKAVMWGRNIYDSIRKFIQFQLTVNVVAVVLTIVGAALLRQAVLSAIQMLWVNLIMDTLASLALATEPPTEELLLRHPHSRDEFIVSKRMMKHIIGQALYQLTIVFIAVFDGENWIPEDAEDPNESIFVNPQNRAYVISGRDYQYGSGYDYYEKEKTYGPSRQFTFIFNLFVWLQVFNFLNARKLHDEVWTFGGMFNSPIFGVIVFMIAGLQALIISVGYTAFECHKHGLNGPQWGICIALGSGGLIWGTCLKFVSEEKMCPEAGHAEADPLHNKSAALQVKRSHNEKSLSRKFSLVHDVGRPSSLNRIHQMS